MNQELKLIYIGILKFGFKDTGKVSVIGLLDYIKKNDLFFDPDPIISVNRSYAPKTEDWFWEMEMWNRQSLAGRCLKIYFDSNGCHYEKYNDIDHDGLIEKYEDFMEKYKWLMEIVV